MPLSQHPLPLNALASILGCTRSSIRHFADRLGFRYTVLRRGPRHQRIACLTAEQAQSIAAELERDLAVAHSPFPLSPHQSETMATLSHSDKREGPASNNPVIQKSNPPAAEGVLYLLQLEPEKDPGRFKLGFTADLEKRLDDLRTAAPYATCIAAWPAQRNWERMAITSIAQTATQIREEVFLTDDLPQIIQAGHDFFKVMPKLAPPRELTWADPPHSLGASAALTGDSPRSTKQQTPPPAILEPPPDPEYRSADSPPSRATTAPRRPQTTLISPDSPTVSTGRADTSPRQSVPTESCATYRTAAVPIAESAHHPTALSPPDAASA